jgi:hypothetical protein
MYSTSDMVADVPEAVDWLETGRVSASGRNKTLKLKSHST